MIDLVVATGNAGKLREFRRIFEPMGITVASAKELGITAEVEETGTTFAENARIKAETIMRLCGKPTIADDSGICVDALGGAPGVYSARYAGEHGTEEACLQKLLTALKDVPEGKRGAQYVCAICCMLPNGDEITAEATCEGKLAFEKRGSGGFGYDPIFITEHGGFAELSAEEKDKFSHRGKALRLFYEEYKNYYDEVKNIADK